MDKVVNVAVVIVGINQWEEYTLPLIYSIMTHEMDVKIVYVDNASDELYPTPGFSHHILVRLNERESFAAAINHGMAATKSADWVIVLNNDVLCEGPFVSQLEWMHRKTLYGNQLIVHGELRWLGLWLFAIPRAVREAVGEFDEKFEVCGFDDADFCFRAAAAGFEIQKSNLPFKHFWGKTRWDIPDYEDIRADNLKYLEEKHGVSLAGEWQVFN